MTEEALKSEPTEKMLGYAKMLNEYSERRRLNTFFVNEQSPFDGVQLGFVNTSSGNLTFLRRDLVRLNRMPLVFGRVYDSRIEANRDFGPGWKIAPFETLETTDQGLRYRDASGASYEFVENGAGFELQTPFYSDFLNIESLEDGVEITYRNLWSRTFETTDNGYRLAQVRDNNANTINYRYENGQLASIAGSYGSVTIERNATGQVAAVVDDLARRIEYRYDDQERLVEVKDLGGSVWSYQYDRRNYLVEMTDPNGNQALQAAFFPDSRASRVNIRSARYHFQSKEGKTEARDFNGGVTVYEHNALGFTRRVTSPAGAVTEVKFDQANQVASLLAGGEIVADMVYDATGNLLTLVRYSAGSDQSIRYDYNWNKNVITARSANSFTKKSNCKHARAWYI